MANPLLDRVLPAELADRTQTFDYKGKVGDFARLREISEAELKAVSAAGRPRNWQNSAVRVSLAFSWLDPDRTLVAATGQITAVLPVVCQRCLEAFEMTIDTPVKMLFGESLEDADHADYDAWEVDGTAVVLQDVVEEAIVMAMPLAPLHESGTRCGDLAQENPADGPETTKPFAGLRARMEAKDT